jgi:hypothetical protein
VARPTRTDQPVQEITEKAQEITGTASAVCGALAIRSALPNMPAVLVVAALFVEIRVGGSQETP